MAHGVNLNRASRDYLKFDEPVPVADGDVFELRCRMNATHTQTLVAGTSENNSAFIIDANNGKIRAFWRTAKPDLTLIEIVFGASPIWTSIITIRVTFDYGTFRMEILDWATQEVGYTAPLDGTENCRYIGVRPSSGNGNCFADIFYFRKNGVDLVDFTKSKYAYPNIVDPQGNVVGAGSAEFQEGSYFYWVDPTSDFTTVEASLDNGLNLSSNANHLEIPETLDSNNNDMTIVGYWRDFDETATSYLTNTNLFDLKLGSDIPEETYTISSRSISATKLPNLELYIQSLTFGDFYNVQIQHADNMVTLSYSNGTSDVVDMIATTIPDSGATELKFGDGLPIQFYSINFNGRKYNFNYPTSRELTNIPDLQMIGQPANVAGTSVRPSYEYENGDLVAGRMLWDGTVLWYDFNDGEIDYNPLGFIVELSVRQSMIDDTNERTLIGTKSQSTTSKITLVLGSDNKFAVKTYGQVALEVKSDVVVTADTKYTIGVRINPHNAQQTCISVDGIEVCGTINPDKFFGNTPWARLNGFIFGAYAVGAPAGELTSVDDAKTADMTLYGFSEYRVNSVNEFPDILSLYEPVRQFTFDSETVLYKDEFGGEVLNFMNYMLPDGFYPTMPKYPVSGKQHPTLSTAVAATPANNTLVYTNSDIIPMGHIIGDGVKVQNDFYLSGIPKWTQSPVTVTARIYTLGGSQLSIFGTDTNNTKFFVGMGVMDSGELFVQMKNSWSSSFPNDGFHTVTSSNKLSLNSWNYVRFTFYPDADCSVEFELNGVVTPRQWWSETIGGGTFAIKDDAWGTITQFLIGVTKRDGAIVVSTPETFTISDMSITNGDYDETFDFKESLVSGGTNPITAIVTDKLPDEDITTDNNFFAQVNDSTFTKPMTLTGSGTFDIQNCKFNNVDATQHSGLIVMEDCEVNDVTY